MLGLLVCNELVEAREASSQGDDRERNLALIFAVAYLAVFILYLTKA